VLYAQGCDLLDNFMRVLRKHGSGAQSEVIIAVMGENSGLFKILFQEGSVRVVLDSLKCNENSFRSQGNWKTPILVLGV
jgi:hypothetical protein